MPSKLTKALALLLAGGLLLADPMSAAAAQSSDNAFSLFQSGSGPKRCVSCTMSMCNAAPLSVDQTDANRDDQQTCYDLNSGINQFIQFGKDATCKTKLEGMICNAMTATNGNLCTPNDGTGANTDSSMAYQGVFQASNCEELYGCLIPQYAEMARNMNLCKTNSAATPEPTAASAPPTGADVAADGGLSIYSRSAGARPEVGLAALALAAFPFLMLML